MARECYCCLTLRPKYVLYLGRILPSAKPKTGRATGRATSSKENARSVDMYDVDLSSQHDAHVRAARNSDRSPRSHTVMGIEALDDSPHRYMVNLKFALPKFDYQNRLNLTK